jgi:hypothetical protein
MSAVTLPARNPHRDIPKRACRAVPQGETVDVENGLFGGERRVDLGGPDDGLRRGRAERGHDAGR